VSAGWDWRRRPCGCGGAARVVVVVGSRTRRRRRFYRRFMWRRGVLTAVRRRLGWRACAGQNSGRTAGPRVARLVACTRATRGVRGLQGSWEGVGCLGKARVGCGRRGRRGAARRRPARPCDTAPQFERLHPQKFV
jgi:hypothetical protein